MRVNSTDMKNSFGRYLTLVQKEDIIIVKNGRSVAKLTKYQEEYRFVHEASGRYTTRVSLEEYETLVHTSDQRYELIDGEVYLLASPSYSHQAAVNEVLGQLYNYFKEKPCRALAAPLDVRLHGYATKFEEDPNVVQPDVVVICDEENVNDDKYEGVPTLVVEVLSPSTKTKDMILKLHLYMKSGVREYWLVDLKTQSVMQYCFSNERELGCTHSLRKDETIESCTFPGLALRASDIFDTQSSGSPLKEYSS